MKITVDSNILLSVFIKDSLFQQAGALLAKYSGHDYVINDCIYLELAVHFQDLTKLDDVLIELEVNLIREPEIDYGLILAAWSRYLKNKSFVCPFCKQEISPVCPECQSVQTFRQRILVDFLIGGFASTHTGRSQLKTERFRRETDPMTSFSHILSRLLAIVMLGGGLITPAYPSTGSMAASDS